MTTEFFHQDTNPNMIILTITTITPKWNTAGAKTPEAGFRLTDTDMRMREMERILHK